MGKKVMNRQLPSPHQKHANQLDSAGSRESRAPPGGRGGPGPGAAPRGPP